MNARQLRAISQDPVHYTVIEITSFVLAAISLLAVMRVHLLSGILSGLLVYQLIQLITPRLSKKLSSKRALWFSIVLLSAAIIGLLTAAISARSNTSNISVPHGRSC